MPCKRMRPLSKLKLASPGKGLQTLTWQTHKLRVTKALPSGRQAKERTSSGRPTLLGQWGRCRAETCSAAAGVYSFGFHLAEKKRKGSKKWPHGLGEFRVVSLSYNCGDRRPTSRGKSQHQKRRGARMPPTR